MSSIDERIVEMRFNGGQFQAGVSSTLTALKDLESGLNLKNVGSNIETVASKFNVFGAMGFSAIQRLTNVAIDSGAKIYNAIVDPLISGGERRSQNFAQANFQLKGLGVTGKDLTKVMDAASYAVDGTAYGLDQAAVAASSFVASNVDIAKLPKALRGISGVAAMTGRDFGDISQIFTTVAGNGRLFATELNRIGSSGVNAAAALAKSLGVTETEVRKMTSDGKINFEMFANAMDDAFGEQATKANDLYSGSLSNLRSALARIGEPLADGKFEQLRLIFNSLTPIINNVKKAMMPLLNSWKYWKIQSGQALAGTLKGLLKTTFSLGNLRPGFNALSSAFNNVMIIAKKFQRIAVDVWKGVFPEKSEFNILTFIGQALNKITDKILKSEWVFAAFRAGLTLFLNVLSLIGKVISSVGKIIWAILEVFIELGLAIWEIVAPLFGITKSLDGASGGMQSFFDMLKMGVDTVVPLVVGWLNKVRDAIKNLRKGGSSGIGWIDKMYKAFMTLRDTAMVKIPEILNNIKNGIRDFFAQDVKGMAGSVASWFSGSKLKVTDLVEGVDIKSIWDMIVGPFQSAFHNLSPITGALTDLIKMFTGEFKGFISGLTKEDLSTAISFTGIIAGIWGFVKVAKSFSKIGDAFTGALNSIGGAAGEFGKYFKALQADVNTNIILKIAIAIGILAGSVWLLAQLDVGKAWSAVGMIAVMFGLLAGSMLLLDKYMTPKTASNMIAVGLAMALLAVGVLILASAVEKFSKIDPDKIAQGMISVALSVGLLVGAMKALGNAGGGKLIAAALAIGILASSLYLMAHVITVFAGLNPETLAQGMITMALSLGLLAGMAQVLAKAGGSMLKASVGLIAIGAALLIVALSINIFAKMDIETFTTGGFRIVMVLAALVAVGLILASAGASFATAAVGILAISAALVLISFAFVILAGLSLENIVVGLIAIAGAMIILAVGAMFMQGAVGGAIAMILLAGAMVIMAFALQMLATIDVDAVTNGLVALMTAMLILGLAAAIMQVFAIGAMVFVAVLLAIGVVAILIAAAILIIVVAIMLLGPAGASASVGLDLLAAAVERNSASMGTMALFGLALLAFGVGAGIAGAGAIILGAGLIILSAGLILLAVTGPIGAMALQMLAARVTALVPAAIPMGIVATALIALGAAAIVAGVGALMLAVGLMLLAPAIMMVSMSAMMIGPAFMVMGMGLKKLAPHAGTVIKLGIGFLILAPGLVAVGAGAMMAGPGMLMLGIGLALVIPLSKLAAPAFKALVNALKPIIPQAPQLTALGAAFLIMGAGLMMMGAAAMMVGLALALAVAGMLAIQKAGAHTIIVLSMLAASAPASSASIVAAFKSMATGISSSASGIASAVTSMMNAMANAIMGGGPLVVAAMMMIVMLLVVTITSGAARMTAAGAAIVNGLYLALISGVPRFTPLGVLYMTMFILGIRMKTPAAAQAAKQVSTVVYAGLMSGVSRARSAGTNTGYAFASALSTTSGRARSAASSVGSAAANGFRNAVSSAASSGYSSGYAMGANVAQGMASGMLSNQYLVVSAASQLAAAIPAKIRKLLGIESPSKVAHDIFTWFVKGGANALVDGIGTMENAAGDMTGALMGSVEDSLKDLSGFANTTTFGDIELNPTIRPVLDLTDVKSGMKELPGLIGSGSIRAESTIDSVRNVAALEKQSKDYQSNSTTTEVTNNYTVNQYNTSPKALSGTDIYRKTKNVMSQIKTVSKK